MNGCKASSAARPTKTRDGASRVLLVVELFGGDMNGRKMIAWGRRIGCRDAGHGFEPGRGVFTRLVVDDGDPQQHNFLMELVDNPVGLRAIDHWAGNNE